MSAAPGKSSIKSLVLAYLAENKPARVDEPELALIRSHVTAGRATEKEVSDRYLLDILSETEVAIARSLGGLPVDLRGRVHFRDAEAAATSLLDLEREFEAARARGDSERAEDCRRAVRQGKDRLRMVLRQPRLSPQKRQEKEELLQWFLIWLETPELFPQWLVLRRRARGG